MKAVIQRVKSAELSIDEKLVSSIGPGYVVYLGVGENDTQKQAEFLADKVAKLRIFEDQNGKMNNSLASLVSEGKSYSILVVSNFTLYGACKGQNRPSFMSAAKPDVANELYEYFCSKINEKYNIEVKTGVFGADMQILAACDGPVNIILDTQEL